MFAPQLSHPASAAFPAWLIELREAGYRIEHLPPHRQGPIRDELARRGIELWHPGARWSTARDPGR